MKKAKVSGRKSKIGRDPVKKAKVKTVKFKKKAKKK